METVVSGIRSTGDVHLGNYFGALKNFVKMQDEYNCFFFIADLHSLTTHPHPEHLHENVKKVLASMLAAGLDPGKCTLYVQSDLPQISQLYLLFNMIAYKGELERVVTYKEKAAKQPENLNAGLLTYPVLMAVDIIIHKATKVPVGKDQKQHLEMTRNLANRFNHMYGVNVFPEPEPFSYSKELVKIPGLDGSGKMGKSEGEKNAIFFVDEPDVIRKKVMRAVSDAGPTAPGQPKSEPVQNLFTLLEAVSSKETIDYFEGQYQNLTIRYGDLKKQLAEDIIIFTDPIRKNIQEFLADDAYLNKVARQGAEKAQENAQKTLDEVRAAIGIKSF